MLGNGTVVRAPTFHQCGPGLTPGLVIILFGLSLFALYSALRSFSLVTPVVSTSLQMPLLFYLACASVHFCAGQILNPAGWELSPSVWRCLAHSVLQKSDTLWHSWKNSKEWSLACLPDPAPPCKDTTYTSYFWLAMMSVSVFFYRINSISHNLKFTCTQWIISHCTDHFGHLA